MKYVLTNWKMYVAGSQAADLLRAVQDGLEQRLGADGGLPRVIVCPPFVSLAPLQAMVDRRLVRLGAQNCHWEESGPYTGEVSPTMLAGLVDYVLIGHSERRAVGETDDQVARKVAAAAETGLTPILFVGEDEPSSGAADDTERRLESGLAGVDLGRRHAVIVYEPTWAIGADRPAEAGHVQEIVARLKDKLAGLGAERPEVIYGGTINAENVDRYAGIGVLDGVGATRAGLDARELLCIVDQVAAAAGSEGGLS